VRGGGATTYVCPAYGVAIVVTVAVRHAIRCTFLTQSGASSSSYAVKTVACASGHASVTVPAIANTSGKQVKLTYAVRVQGAGKRFVRRGVTITEVAPQRVITPPPEQPTPLPLPPTPVVPTASPPQPAYQDAWSGYSVLGGPFTAVSGTFNVPNLNPAPAFARTSDWVGIDGAFNDSLIQAGVDETYDPATGSITFRAWWEILPAYSTPISMPVAAGDQITVTIGQVIGTLWQISLTDDTTGQRFVTNQTYTGPGASAEWIVEAVPALFGGALYPLGNYDPPVTFGNLRVDGVESALSESIMVQGGAITSIPSALTANGFSVAYGDAPPAPP